MSIRARKPEKVTLSRAAAYDTILRPIITEKATQASENGQVTFAVPLSATKPEIKAAVEMLFDVNVTAVNTILLKGKSKMFKGRPGRRSDMKKAMVTLAEGQNIDLMGV
ncbi:50S ribosomal protein L23 [Candidatus Puniceispirillum marinum]|jgi:large subunit ribosomal protein L23|uniref:Large ribosomal subunit protein uL23 n=1 Tax=Puniceispirillum marinum (strain IMCC1322) TaxID=488538 RepID=D5BPY4_PUNMI|nr:50S ribosomal protein L23 [Candidatus Puniceispirillum marinum]ADE40636.1 Ribosomal protein L25/L23 [Candidatus Puniceispirillum marinum IMCC1322]